MLMLLSLIALTVAKPTDVEYPVVGTSLVLSCDLTVDIAGSKTYAWYKGADDQSTTTQTLTINGETSNDGDYKCIVIVDGKRSAKSPGTNVAFNSKYLIIQPLLPK
jgi:hypothetical protein